MTQINFGVRKDMEIPFGISISIIKVKHWPAYRTKLESADSIFRSADLDVQFLGQVTDRYSSDENNISMEKTPAFSIFHVKHWSAYRTWLESANPIFRSADLKV